MQTGEIVPALRRHWMLLTLAFLSAIVFSRHLSERSLWYDEGVSVGIASMPPSSALAVMPKEPNMMLYYALLRLWMLLGNSEEWIRSLSVMGAVAAVTLTFVLARRWAGSRAALIAALLLVSNEFLNDYAQEARSYAWLTCVAVACMWFAEKAVSSGARRPVILFAVLSAAAAYLHVLSVFLFIAAAVVFLVSRYRARVYEAGFLYGVLTLPLWIIVMTKGQENIAWIPRLSAASLLAGVEYLMGNAGWVPVMFYTLAVITFCARTVRQPDTWRTLLLSWALLPGGAMILVSVVGYPLFVSRFLIMSLPALAIITAVSLDRVIEMSTAVGGLLTVALIACNVALPKSAMSGADDMRSAVRFMASREAPGDAVVLYWFQSVFSYQYYAERIGIKHAAIVCPEIHPPEQVFVQPRGNLDKLMVSPRVWFVEQANGDDSSAPTLQAIRLRYCATSEERHFGSLSVRLCQRSASR
jgi:mannosyltransferase